MNASAFYYDYRHKNIPATGRVNTNIDIYESDYGEDFNDDGDLLDNNVFPPGTPSTYVKGEVDNLPAFLHDPWESQFGDFESYGDETKPDPKTPYVERYPNRFPGELDYVKASKIT